MKKLDQLLNKIAEAQVKYHITGGQIESEYKVEYTTAGGTDVVYEAKRMWSERGLSFAIWKHETSIAKGHKETYIGHTHPFGREIAKIV